MDLSSVNLTLVLDLDAIDVVESTYPDGEIEPIDRDKEDLHKDSHLSGLDGLGFIFTQGP